MKTHSQSERKRAQPQRSAGLPSASPLLSPSHRLSHLPSLPHPSLHSTRLLPRISAPPPRLSPLPLFSVLSSLPARSSDGWRRRVQKVTLRKIRRQTSGSLSSRYTLVCGTRVLVLESLRTIHRVM